MVHVITGPPCSGKTTYVREHAKDGDLRIDFDVIAQALGAADDHFADGIIWTAAKSARKAAIETAFSYPVAESWVIHAIPTKEQLQEYREKGAEITTLDPGYEVCMERAQRDNRPQHNIDGIRQWYGKGRKMEVKKKTFSVKADNGSITGYASTWIREPDSYGDIVKAGAFKESIDSIKAEGKVLPLLFNHDSDDLEKFIGTVTDLEEDDHGLKFTATFDDTPEAKRARELAMDGRLAKFSFAYDVLDQGTVTLEDGREANELRKLNIHEVSLVMYPANPDTSVISVKSGRRNSAKDAEKINQAITLLKEVLGELDDTENDEEGKAKSEEPDTANDEEQTRMKALLKKAEDLLK